MYTNTNPFECSLLEYFIALRRARFGRFRLIEANHSIRFAACSALTSELIQIFHLDSHLESTIFALVLVKQKA